jgi:hypothetical protein
MSRKPCFDGPPDYQIVPASPKTNRSIAPKLNRKNKNPLLYTQEGLHSTKQKCHAVPRLFGEQRPGNPSNIDKGGVPSIGEAAIPDSLRLEIGYGTTITLQRSVCSETETM